MYKLTADREAGAKIIALACSEPPPERSRRTLNLLAGKVVKLDILDSISDHGTGDLLKNGIKLTSSQASKPHNFSTVSASRPVPWAICSMGMPSFLRFRAISSFS